MTIQESRVSEDGGGMSEVTHHTVAVGQLYSCATVRDRSVRCWGRNDIGQLGGGMTPVLSSIPVVVQRVNDTIDISTGLYHACALRSDHAVLCWGINVAGGLGDGVASHEMCEFAMGTQDCSSTPVRVTGVTDAVTIGCGPFSTCFVHASGRLSCTGDYFTRLVSELRDVRDVAIGPVHACVRHRNGGVSCWGGNHDGQLGIPGELAVTALVTVENLTNVVQIAVGEAHSCALLATGAVSCWGSNQSGQLGDGTTVSRAQPASVLHLTDAVAIASGSSHVCALRSSGGVVCWGEDGTHELGPETPTATCVLPGGIGRVPCSLVPLTVDGVSDAIEIAAGVGNTCARLRDQNVLCWGSNSDGQLGDPDAGPARGVPSPVRGL